MKRDMDLIRQILIKAEEVATGHGFVELEIPDKTEGEVSYHIKLLDQAGLVEGIDLTTMDGLSWGVVALTWEGHEFLDAARNEGLWQKAKTLIVEKGGGLSFDVLKAVLVEMAKTAVGGSLKAHIG